MTRTVEVAIPIPQGTQRTVASFLSASAILSSALQQSSRTSAFITLMNSLIQLGDLFIFHEHYDYEYVSNGDR